MVQELAHIDEDSRCMLAVCVALTQAEVSAEQASHGEVVCIVVIALTTNGTCRCFRIRVVVESLGRWLAHLPLRICIAGSMQISFMWSY